MLLLLVFQSELTCQNGLIISGSVGGGDDSDRPLGGDAAVVTR